MKKMHKGMIYLAPLLAMALPAVAGAQESDKWEIGVVLDAAHTSKMLELSRFDTNDFPQ